MKSKNPCRAALLCFCVRVLLGCSSGGNDTTHGTTTDGRDGGQSASSGAPSSGAAGGASGSSGNTNSPPGIGIDAGPGSDDAGGAPAMMPPKLPNGAVSKPGTYSGLGDAIYKSYALTSQYVAVRDGTKLAVDLYRPQDASGKVVETPLPVIWMHTPYNRRYFYSSTMGVGVSGETYPGAAARLIPYGYVVAIVDFRGVYASYGTNAAYNRGEWMDAAKLDAYDITEWLAKQTWSTGAVGMWGCSATGGSQMQALTAPSPHLKAVFPMSCEFDVYPFGVPGGMAPPKGTDTKAPPTGGSSAQRDPSAVAVDGDIGNAQLNAAIAQHANNIENPGYVPFRDSVASNIPVAWWIKSSPHTYLDQINQSGVAVYVAANWDEAATKYGAFFTFNNLKTPHKMVIGPSTHCAWFTVQADTGSTSRSRSTASSITG